MIYLLDTDTVISLMRGLKITKPRNPSEDLRRATGQKIFETAREREISGHQVALSAVTVAELEFGAWKSGRYEREIEVVRRVLTPFALIDFDANTCAMHYGEVRALLESRGIGIGSVDTFIAAHALALGAMLVTNNVAEFMRVPELKLERWC